MKTNSIKINSVVFTTLATFLLLFSSVFGQNGGSDTLTITGDTFDSTDSGDQAAGGDLTVANAPGSIGVVNISGGTNTIADNIRIGESSVDNSNVGHGTVVGGDGGVGAVIISGAGQTNVVGFVAVGNAANSGDDDILWIQGTGSADGINSNVETPVAPIIQIWEVGAEGAFINFTTEVGNVYTIEQSYDLKDWHAIHTETASESEISYVDESNIDLNERCVFYRVKAEFLQ